MVLDGPEFFLTSVSVQVITLNAFSICYDIHTYIYLYIYIIYIFSDLDFSSKFTNWRAHN